MRLGAFLLVSNVEIQIVMMLIVARVVVFFIRMIEDLKLFVNNLAGVEAVANVTVDLVLELLLVVIHMHEIPLTRMDLKQVERDDDRLLVASQEEHVAVLIQPQLERRVLVV